MKAKKASTKKFQITQRQKRMLDMIVAGKRVKQMARALRTTCGVVRVWLHFLYRQLRVKDMTGAAVWWLINQKDVKIYEEELA